MGWEALLTGTVPMLIWTRGWVSSVLVTAWGKSAGSAVCSLVLRAADALGVKVGVCC
jgi:hypothetical protein